MLFRRLLLIFFLFLPFVPCMTAYSSELFPFVDINDVMEIRVAEKHISFSGRNGYRYFDLQKESWKLWFFDHPKKARPKELIEWHELVPSWYQSRRPYVQTASYTSDHQYILLRLAGEGAVSLEEEIIDAQKGKVYRIPYQDSRVIAASGSDIWVGYQRGITRINTETDQRTDYYVLPRFRRIAGWVDYKSARYITTEDGDFLAMEISTGAISRIHIPDSIVTEMLGAPTIGCSTERGAIDTHFLFTNPLVVNNILYIGVVSKNIILLYDLDSEQWRHIKLGQISGIRKLTLLDQTIWCIGNWWTAVEGGDFVEFGGLAAITNGDRVTAFPELESIPIGGFRIDGDILRILTAKFLEAYDGGGVPQRSNELPEHRASDLIFSISLETMKVEEKIPITKDSPTVNQFTPLRFTLSADEQKDISRWRVQAHMIEVADREVQVLSKEGFEKRER